MAAKGGSASKLSSLLKRKTRVPIAPAPATHAPVGAPPATATSSGPAPGGGVIPQAPTVAAQPAQDPYSAYYQQQYYAQQHYAQQYPQNQQPSQYQYPGYQYPGYTQTSGYPAAAGYGQSPYHGSQFAYPGQYPYPYQYQTAAPIAPAEVLPPQPTAPSATAPLPASTQQSTGPTTPEPAPAPVPSAAAPPEPVAQSLPPPPPPTPQYQHPYSTGYPYSYGMPPPPIVSPLVKKVEKSANLPEHKFVRAASAALALASVLVFGYAVYYIYLFASEAGMNIEKFPGIFNLGGYYTIIASSLGVVGFASGLLAAMFAHTRTRYHMAVICSVVLLAAAVFELWVFAAPLALFAVILLAISPKAFDNR